MFGSSNFYCLVDVNVKDCNGRTALHRLTVKNENQSQFTELLKSSRKMTQKLMNKMNVVQHSFMIQSSLILSELGSQHFRLDSSRLNILILKKEQHLCPEFNFFFGISTIPFIVFLRFYYEYFFQIIYAMSYHFCIESLIDVQQIVNFINVSVVDAYFPILF